MTTRHLVTDSDFSLLGNVNLCELHHAVLEFVTDLDHIHLPLALGCCCLLCEAVVVDEVANEDIGLLVGSPLVRVDIVIIDTLEKLCSELLVLLDNLDTVKVAYACALLVLCENGQLLDELRAEFLVSHIVELLLLVKLCLLLCLGSAGLSAAFLGKLCIKRSLDNGTAKRRISLE